MKKVKLLGLSAVALLAAAGLSSCGGRADLVVWAPVEHKEFYEKLFEEFKASNEEYKDITIEFGTCSEGDAYTNISKDVAGGADVFTFANDQLFNLINVGALNQLGGTNLSYVTDNNDPLAVESASNPQDDKVYAYPMTLDNGYMLTYDATVVTDYDEDTTFAEVAAQCAAAGKKFVVPMGDAWYAYGFFSGFGGTYDVTYVDGKESKIECDYNGAAGVNAGTFMVNLAKTAGFQYVDGGNSGDQSLILNQYLSAHMEEIGAFISYPSAVKTYVFDTDAWGDENVRCGLLPMMEGKDGAKARMSTFLGTKLVGVNALSENQPLAHAFARFITSEDVQLKRYEEFSYGPSNNVAKENEKVKADVALSGLNAQFEEASQPQINVPSTFWTAMQNFGTACGYPGFKDPVTLDNLQEKLNNLTTNITTIVS